MKGMACPCDCLKLRLGQTKNLEFQHEKGWIKTVKVWVKGNIAHIWSQESIVSPIDLLTIE